MHVDNATFLPEGNFKRQSVCIALVGDREISIRWAIRAMSINFPLNCMRSILCYVHPNLDVSRNISIREWKNAPIEMRTEWIALLAAESTVKSDAVVACIISGKRFNKIGDSYVIHKDCIKNSPWFKDNTWVGGEVDVTDRSDLLQDYYSSTFDAVGGRSEIDAKKLLTVCIPTLGKTSMLWAAHAIQLASPMVCSHTTMVAQGHEIGDARERIINTVLETKPASEYCLFYGDDNLPGHDALTLLFETMHKTNANAVAGLYYMKNSPPDVPILWRNNKAGPLLPGVDFKLGEVVQVDGTGLDFCLFRTEALSKVPRPRFRTVVDWVEGRGMIVQTEDAYFWQKWLDTFGEGPLVDTRCRVGHYNHVNGVVYG
jgi:hypothetical protein